MNAFARNVVPLHASEQGGDGERAAGESAPELEPETKTNGTAGASPDDVDLDALMAKLKALAAKAQQLPARRSNKQRAVMATAIALSISSGAATGQYLVPGHARAAVAPGKGFAATTASVDVTIGNGARRAAGGLAGGAIP
jgi:hypothetical protein